ncbi:M20/M25/M40 family metallo-hydrolase [Kibdelosporangium philippinense]|uniref:M20/M25/M40 family metallo-hydrolase n=1 Tax=Kibdelosporangium philippinense TaxID=211113 RepID=A0ABS8Z6E1_9PSEU|nr:M20/M25/M40 family metallo-hydrolase [Kibdelosporangium philippinense]MCE7003380.1 M20/M25/M40 family metallo-hydrolase [Kibdelosporangium philippinense]
MSNSEDRGISRRVMLGGAAALAGAGLVRTPVAFADNAPAPLNVEAVASQLDSGLIALRRDIRCHPEVAGQERRTAGLVAQRLRSAGLAVTTGVGGHGVVGVLKGARPGRTVAYRADMDAVPPDAQIPGGLDAAHVCGHDIHTTVGVGVAEVLARLRDRMAGTVVFIFQPAEESLAGAAAMLADGVLRATRPSEIHAMHCAGFSVGKFAVTPGFGMPGLDRGTITLTGSDAMGQAQRLAREISELGTVSFPSTPEDLERVTAEIQIPNGPLAQFIFMRTNVPDGQAAVSVSYRCWPESRYRDVRADIRRLAQSYNGATVSFPDDPFPAMHCPEREGRAIRQYLRQAFGHDNVATLHAAIPFNGEDFALFLDQIPGTYTFLGVRAPGAAIETSYPHFGTFTPDERAIGYGVRAMAGWLASRIRP